MTKLKIIQESIELNKQLALLNEKILINKGKLKTKLKIGESIKEEGYTISYKKGYERISLDSDKIKKEHPKIYKKSLKTTNIKGSITIIKPRAKKEDK